MKASVVVFLMLLNKQLIVTSKLLNGGRNDTFQFKFLAVVVHVQSQKEVSIGVVISHFWVLAVAHLFPSDSSGINHEDYVIIAGRYLKEYKPNFAITHPAYTHGLYTAEDFILFRVTKKIDTRPIYVLSGRFPWNLKDCYFMSYNTVKTHMREKIMTIKIEVTTVQNCMSEMRRKPTGLLRFYMNDLLCSHSSKYHNQDCLGKTGGVLVCIGLLVGLLIRPQWCRGEAVNFTDVGMYSNWLYSRVHDASYIALTTNRN